MLAVGVAYLGHAANSSSADVAWLQRRVAELEAQAATASAHLQVLLQGRRELHEEQESFLDMVHAQEHYHYHYSELASDDHAAEGHASEEHTEEHAEHTEHDAHAGEHGAAGEHGCASEHGEHGASQTIFKMPDHFDLRFTVMTIGVLVLVTIAFEKGSETLDEAVHEHGAHIENELLQKMFKELTILGFVAFSATLLLQAELMPLTHEQHLNYEFSHILMFATAIMYAVNVWLISRMLNKVMQRFNKYDEMQAECLLKEQVRRYGERCSEKASGPELLLPQDEHTRLYEKVRDTVHGAFSYHSHCAIFKCLKLQFLGFNGMLTSRFSVSEYIHRCTELHVGEMVDIDPRAWFLLLVLLCAFYMGSFTFLNSPVLGTLLFVVYGVALLLSEILLLFATRTHLDHMLEMGHHIRTEEEGDRWEEYKAHQAIIEAELTVLTMSMTGGKAEKNRINDEMQKAAVTFYAEVLEGEEYNKRKLDKLEVFFQFQLLAQSMLQALIFLMLMRNALIFAPLLVGDTVVQYPAMLLLVFLLFMPTLLMSQYVTPRVLECLALAFAIGVKNKEVLDKMREEATHEGDYAQAGQVLQLAMTQKLSDADLDSEETVRDKVKDLIKLGELKWRYRVVEENENPKDEAIKVLDEAHDYIERQAERALSREASDRVGEGREKKDLNQMREFKAKHWPHELSEVCQGLALARLIFNTDRKEDTKIEELLHEALHMREIIKDKEMLAQTHNSLGALAQKQAVAVADKRKQQELFEESERAYKKALKLRDEIKPGNEAQVKEKDQSLAQSYVSLGNLYSDMGSQAERHEAQDQYLSQALEQLGEAKRSYIKGFNARHPKVAWAVEAQAKVHQKMRNYRLAQESISEAIALRKGLQEKSDGKALFNKEIDSAEGISKQLSMKRLEVKNRLSVLSRNAVTANRRTSQVAPADGDSADGGGMGHLRSSKPPSLPMPSPAHIKQLLKREESAKKLSGAGGKALV